VLNVARIAHNTLTDPFFIGMVVAKEKGGEAVNEAHY
jgi:RNase P protein component